MMLFYEGKKLDPSPEIGEWRAYIDNEKLSRKQQFERVKSQARAIEDRALKKMSNFTGFNHHPNKATSAS